MKRTKLAPASLPPNSFPQTNWYQVPRCFVCDEAIKSHRLSTSLLSGKTQFSQSALPSKIGEYIGDDFLVVVTSQDALCKQCMSLINTMDRLEQELIHYRSTLTQNLRKKYGLDGNSRRPEDTVKEVNDSDVVEIVDSEDEDWTPSTQIKKPRKESTKQHRCLLCSSSFSNLNHFMAHLSHHKKEKPKTAVTPSLSSKTSSTSVIPTVFKCGCCSKCFQSKLDLAEHMRLHTLSQRKSVPKSTIEKSSSLEKNLSSNPASTQLECSATNLQTKELFHDLDELPHPDISVDATVSGMCTEQQKGKVCLLALLNNGICSDISHRSVVEKPLATSVIVSIATELQNRAPTITLSDNSNIITTKETPASSSENHLSSDTMSVTILMQEKDKENERFEREKVNAVHVHDMPSLDCVQLNDDDTELLQTGGNLNRTCIQKQLQTTQSELFNVVKLGGNMAIDTVGRSNLDTPIDWFCDDG